ncbi:MAG: aldehyde dehydrogenase family protein, partial [Gemmobacter sp.]
MRIAPPDSAVSELLPSVVTFLKSPGMLIGSETLAATTGETFAVFNPATGAELARVPAGTAADVDRAVKAAQAAFEGPWSQMLPVQRQGLMLKLADLIEQNGEELAQLETLNQGKSILLSRLIEVQSSAEYIRYMAGWSTKIQGTTLDVSIPIPPGMRYQAFTRKEAVGVVAAITPWNFPLNMAVWKIAPALAAGCTVVLKPAEETPLTSIRLAQLALEAGIPPGVVNVVTGMGHEAGAALVAHPGIAKITFTGSTETGKLIGIQAMKDMKRVTLELGGKAPMVMFDDMDLDLLGVAAGIGAFFNTGQTCCAGTRIYAQKGIYEKALEVIAGVTRSLAIGSGLDPANQINPVVSARHQAHVKACIARGLE